MKRFRCFLLLLLIVFSGCAAPMTPPKEKPLTEEELFRATLDDAVNKVYNDMALISEATDRYHDELGVWPRSSASGLQVLVENGYLDALPGPIDARFWRKGAVAGYRFDSAYDEMDGATNAEDSYDVVLYNNGNYIDEFCLAFISKHASNVGNLRSEIFAFDSYDKRYPGQVFGREALVYAFKLRSEYTGACQIHWIMQYKD